MIIIIYMLSHINRAAMNSACCLLLSDVKKKCYGINVELLFKMISHVHTLKSSIPDTYIE